MQDENLVETQYFQPTDKHPASAEAASEFKPWVSIWTSPRKTIRQILNTDPTFYVLPLICLNGIAEFLNSASGDSTGDDLPLSAILLLALVIGPIIGLIGVWVFSHLIRISGRWLGGVAEYVEIKPAVVWGSLPNVAALLLWIPMIGILGREAFTSSTEVFDNDPFQAVIVFGLALQQIVLGIWSLVLTCNTVAEVQEYQSAWRGFGNMLLAGLLIVVPIIVIVATIVGLITALG